MNMKIKTKNELIFRKMLMEMKNSVKNRNKI